MDEDVADYNEGAIASNGRCQKLIMLYLRSYDGWKRITGEVNEDEGAKSTLNHMCSRRKRLHK